MNADDIPGVNSWKSRKYPEEIFSTGRSEYAGQAVGLIVAETRDVAIEAAKKVKVSYGNFGPVVTDIEVAMENANNIHTVGSPLEYGDVTSALANSVQVISGRIKMGSQYHFTMETQVCIAKPTDEGFDVELLTQNMALAANVISKAMDIPTNRFYFH